MNLGAPKSFVIGIFGLLSAKLTLFTMFVLQPMTMVEFFSEMKWASVLQQDWGVMKEGEPPKTTLIAGSLGEIILLIDLPY